MKVSKSKNFLKLKRYFFDFVYIMYKRKEKKENFSKGEYEFFGILAIILFINYFLFY